ncbi:UbiD family decarboxylase [Desulfurococcaceae archaeon MEX13E-LK6-19]|nr:UbiD family decarboxylase [Desulfurococcaceae archaeon MEX13E-LK6-19]
MSETSVWGFFDKLRENGFSIDDKGVISSLFDVTRIVAKQKDPFIASIKNSFSRIYANVVSSRKHIHLMLNVRNDVESYKKILEALNNPTKGVVDNFRKYFEETSYTLKDLPFIKFYREDGGYYLTSSIYCTCIDSVCNASYHRTMLIDENKAVLRIVPRHLYRIYNTYSEMRKDTPVAIILGVHPVIELASSTSPPYGVYELYVANRLLDNKLAFVETPQFKIPVPATASIVVEGVISRDEEEWEGPFVDILRLADKRRKQPVFKLSSIYVNKEFEPLVHAIVPGFEEHILLMGYPREALIWDSVRRVTDVKAVRLTPGSGGWLHAVIAIRKKNRGEAKNVVLAAFTGHPSLKSVIVVDDDIDVDNPLEVEWALATRFQASRDLIIIKSARGSTLDPSGDDGVVDKLGFDATIPLEKPKEEFKKIEIP